MNRVLPEHLRQVNARIAIRVYGYRWHRLSNGTLRLTQPGSSIAQFYGRLATAGDIETAEKTRLWDAEVPNICYDEGRTWFIVRLFQVRLGAYLNFCGGLKDGIDVDGAKIGFGAAFYNDKVQQLPFGALTPTVAICSAIDNWLAVQEPEAWFTLTENAIEKITPDDAGHPDREHLDPVPFAPIERIARVVGVKYATDPTPADPAVVVRRIEQMVRAAGGAQKLIDLEKIKAEHRTQLQTYAREVIRLQGLLETIVEMTENAKGGSLGHRVFDFVNDSMDTARGASQGKDGGNK